MGKISLFERRWKTVFTSITIHTHTFIHEFQKCANRFLHVSTFYTPLNVYSAQMYFANSTGNSDISMFALIWSILDPK